MKKPTKATRNLLISVAVMLVFMIIMLILRTNSSVCEFICSRLVNAYQAVFGRVFSLVGFNVFELFAALAVLAVLSCVISSIVLFCKKKRVASRRVMLSLLLSAVCVANIYVFAAGFAYNRDSAPVEEYAGEIDVELTTKVYLALLSEYNGLYENFDKNDDKTVICPYTEAELMDNIRAAVDSVLTDGFYYSYTPKAKPVTCSEIMAQNRISGITFLPTVEPGYNKDMTIIEKCYTTAHEYAHSKGVMREDEANVVGAYALLYSGDDFLKYCAYVNIIWDIPHFMPSIILEEDKETFSVNEGFFAEWKKISAYWKDKNAFAKFGEFVNDLYLKFNGQEEGTGSYDEDPSTEIIDSGMTDENGDPIFITVVVEYTKLDRMIIGYYTSNLE
ncbi:MAG: DUF3810 domain-containing protein [Clostridia bacterium]|nr:DUF3810 domain-containing protein [Clostridia bacterium]MDE7328368.1 DUF3810 domain-containing protein [Clostridia bacterium]